MGQLLAGGGVDVNKITNYGGSTALHFAAYYGQYQAVCMLLEKEA